MSHHIQTNGTTEVSSQHYFNFDEETLIQQAVANGEGVLNNYGVLCTYTGEHTGRSPNAKYTVRDSFTEDTVDWNNNQSISEEEFEQYYTQFDAFRQNNAMYVQDVQVVRDEALRMSIRVYAEFAKHSLFARNMFIPNTDDDFTPEWQIIHVPSLLPEPRVLLSFKRKTVLISGTYYAGEMKKSIFTVLNFNFLERGLPMHCSVNVDKDRKNPAIFFGLSGTGKTTLSADESRILIGDDEHGWSDKGLTNFEGGCYAKTIRLRQDDEPQIWDASHTAGAMLENVILVDGEPDFNDDSLTENTRSSYPTRFISGADEAGYVSEQPKNVIMLTCDAFGVLPAVMRLKPEEAVEQFLLGYTAKVAGTEKGVSEPKATFSACFGLPFMPRSPKIYGEKLKELVNKYDVDCWLVNTGWSGGSYGTGKRMPISVTRKIIDAIHDGSLVQAELKKHEPTGFIVPMLDTVKEKYLIPELGWDSAEAYHTKLNILLEKFALQKQNI